MAEGLFDFFTREAGQERRRALEGLLTQFIPPEMRPQLGLLAEANPVVSMERAGQDAQQLFAPDQSLMDRLAAGGRMASNMAGVVAPAMVAGRAGVPVANAVQEVLTGYAPAVQPFLVDEFGGVAVPGRVSAPFDMGGGGSATANAPARLAYERRGSDIVAGLQDHVSVDQVLGKEFLGFGSGFTGIKSRQPSLLPEHYSRGLLSSELVAPEPANFDSLIGRDILSIVGDNTGRHTVMQVGDKVLPDPVKSMAGFQYIDVDGQGYAGAKTATSSKANEARASVDPYYMSVLMGDQSGDFARHTGNIYGQLARLSNLSSSDVAKADAFIRNISLPIKKPVVQPDGSVKNVGITTKPFIDFPTVADPSALLNYINNLPSGTARAYFLKGLDKAGLEKMGLPSVGEARLAAADARQIGMDWGTTGYRGFTPDLDKGPQPTTPSQSTTYDTGINKIGNAQTFIGEGMGLPANLVFRDQAEAMREKGTGGRIDLTSADYKVLESSPKAAKQRGDAQLADTINTFLEVERRFGRDAAMGYGRQLLSGGKITRELMEAARKANAPAWMLAAMAPTGAGLLAMQPEQEQY